MSLKPFVPEMDGQTPNGKPCWIPSGELAKIIREQAKGCYQAEVAENLIRNGYLIGYRATGSQLKGKAAKYQSHYAKSLMNMITRIEDVLPGTLEIKRDAVGPKGAFGYRLVI